MDGLAREDRCTQMMTQIYDLTKDNVFCDLILAVENEKFNVHKCVIAAASKKLREMIVQDIKQQKQGAIRTLYLENVNANGVRHLLDYIYCGMEPNSTDLSGMKDFKKACRVLEFSLPHSLEELEWQEYNEKMTTPGMTNNCAQAYSGEEMIIEVMTSPVSDHNNDDGSLHISCDELHHNVKVEPVDIFEKNPLENFNAEDLATVKLLEVDDQDSSNKTELIIQILNDEMQEICDSDAEYMSDSSADDDSDEEETSKRKRGKENANYGPPIKRTKVDANEEMNLKEKPVVTRDFDIRALFTAKKRDASAKNGKLDRLPPPVPDPKLALKRGRPRLDRLPPPVPDPKLALKRGRPRLANDHIFPNQAPFICPHITCTKICDSREKLKKHYHNHDIRSHTCGQCHKKFLYKKDLVTHLRIHTGEKPFRCKECGSGFTQKSTLQYHMKMHDDARMEYSCEECGQHYKTFKGLQGHVERLHSDMEKKVFMPDLAMMQNPVPCPVCSKRFHNYQSVYQHLKRQHPDSDEAQSTLQNRKSRRAVMENVAQYERELLASMSTREEPSQEDILLPIETTVEESPAILSCIACGNNYENEDVYLKHLVKCEGATQYLCDYCELPFKTEQLRDEHVQAVHESSNNSCETVETSVATSFDGIVTSESIDGVTKLNLENMFQNYTT